MHPEHYVKVQVMLPQAKELPEAKKEDWNRSFPSAFMERIVLWTP